MNTTPTPGDLSARLLACPFCGGVAERIDFGPGAGDNEGGSCIACTKCQASGPVEFGYKENFVSNWNRRAALSALPAAGGEVTEWRWVDERGRAMTSWKQGDPPPMTAVSDTKGTMSVEVRTTPQPSAAECPACKGVRYVMRVSGQATCWRCDGKGTIPADAAVGAQGGGAKIADEIMRLVQHGATVDWRPNMAEIAEKVRRLAAPAAVGAQGDGDDAELLRDLWTAFNREDVTGGDSETCIVLRKAIERIESVAPAAGKGVDDVQVREALDALEWAAGSQPTPHAAEYAATVRAALTRQPVAGDGDADFELWQDGEFVAGSSGPRAEAWREILHYAAQYEQDGAVTIMEVIRRPLAAPAATPTDGGEGRS